MDSFQRKANTRSSSGIRSLFFINLKSCSKRIKHHIIRTNLSKGKLLEEAQITFAPDRQQRVQTVSRNERPLVRINTRVKPSMLAPLNLSVFTNEQYLEKTGCFGNDNNNKKPNVSMCSGERSFRIRSHPRILDPFKKLFQDKENKKLVRI